MRSVLFLLALPLAAQSLTISAGVPGDPGVGGYAYSSSALATQPAPFNHLRASATTIAYDIPVANGSCQVALQFIENRPAGPDPASQSAIGTRVFTVTANGSAPVTVDIFAAVGALAPYTLPLAPIPVVDSHLRLQLAAVRGNAVISGFTAKCTPTPSITGIPCVSTQPGYSAIMIQLPDKSCLPLIVVDDKGPVSGTGSLALTGQPTPDGNYPVVLVKLPGQ